MASATSSPKPVIVLVPGAWHSPAHYVQTISLLEASGYQVVTKQNPSAGSSSPEMESTEKDATAVREELLMPLINAGKDVVLLMHSYGGCPGAAAATGLSKVELSQQGKEGGIIGLAFVCAFVANEGESLLSKLPGQQFDPWVNIQDDGQLDVEDPKNVFYNGVPAPLADSAIADLKKQSRASLSTPSSAPAWPQSVYNGRRSYLQCTQDNAIPFIAQQMMVQYSGVEWNTTQIESGHSPFLSHPKQTVDWILQQVQTFVSAV